MNQEIIKATDANKSIAKVNILDAMEMQLKKQLKRVSLNLSFHLKTKPMHKFI